ncbi:hypothetical protein EDB85DRAFT_2145566 [Lactarius pseudohatsudake]|nr:hypothetical protein EDB85DRAFT_2145566 [Lactarius pseudohatsudake]
MLAQGPSLDSNQIAEWQGGSSQLRVEVTVLLARNIPRIKKQFGLKRRFFVSVTSQVTQTTQKTSLVSVATEGSAAEWNENLDAFIVPPPSGLALRLYAKGFARRDLLIGMHEMVPVESQTSVTFTLTNSDRQAGQSIQPVMLDLTVIVSPNTTFYPVLPMPLVACRRDGNQGVSPAENALHGAGEAMETIDLSKTWEGALERLKWVMDTVSSVAELHPYAKMAYSLFFAIPKTLLEQFRLDDDIRTLLVAMHDAFDFANQEDRFKAIGRVSTQVQILTLMLQHVCNCCDFIQSYAKDSQFWKRTLTNIGGQVNKQIEDFHTTLHKLQKAFLDEATITTEITALQILDDVLDAELDAKIREIPYGIGSRFTPDQGCLLGTRTAFLDFIVNWVNDPASGRCLILFGQAGTGKSSIAHEIARRFDTMHRLTSSFIFLRKEQSKPHHLFTTLARDLSDRYPSFKAALGRVVKDSSSLRVGTRDYATLFQSLILEPLKDLHIVGPILVVIDALDESGDATGRLGLHTFLAKKLIRLPSNFRVFITSRPENGIETALVGAQSVEIRHMNDPELAARTHDDILALLRERLPSDKFRDYGNDLATWAEDSFHRAVDASQDLEGWITDQKARLRICPVAGQPITSTNPLSISPERASLRGRHIVDSEPSVITRTSARRAPLPLRLLEKRKSTPLPVPTRAVEPSLPLTVTPRELEAPTSEDPLRALGHVCAFLASSIVRARQRDELGVMPPLAGLEPYLDPVRADLAYIDEVVAAEAEEGSADDGTKVTVTEALLKLNGICAFLASNIARAEQGAELCATPPLVELEPYFDAVLADLVYIHEVVAEKRADAEEESRADDGAAEMKVAIAKSTEGAAASGASEPGIGESHNDFGISPQTSQPSHGPVGVGRFTVS